MEKKMYKIGANMENFNRVGIYFLKNQRSK